MNELNPLGDQNQTPEDVATLYSWANLHGAKYREFSASRAQTRERARLRAEQDIEAGHSLEEEQQFGQQPVETAAAADGGFTAEELRVAEQALEAEMAAAEAARQQEQAAGQAREQTARHLAQQAAEHISRMEAGQAEGPAAGQGGWQQPWRDRFAPAPVPAPPRSSWATPGLREPIGRPAWLSGANPEAAAAPPPLTPSPAQPYPPPPSYLPAPAEDSLNESPGRRWFALRGVFDLAPPRAEPVPAPSLERAPALAVFSLAGGVGKTSLVATLGRALSSQGERVLLVDTAAFGLLPFFFGGADQRPGLLRTFSPPGASSDVPIQMVTIDPEGLGPEQFGEERFGQEKPGQDSLNAEIQRHARGVSRIIVDLATASGATTRHILRLAPLVLVPVVPDMNSVVSVSSIDAFFEHNSIQADKPALPYYVLNRFDAAQALDLDVREVLREQLGERLLPFALRRAPAMSEALAEGMTVMDYAPGSALAEDFVTLAGWLRSLAAPAAASYRGVRWCEL